MSVYNNEKTIKNAIESILNQSYKNIELLIIDDCSEDNTYQIIAQFQIIKILNYSEINQT